MFRDFARRASPWGDQIAEDGWSSFLAVRSWDDCATDEYIRVFPNLLNGPPDVRLISHIEQALAVLAWRCDRTTGISRDLASLPVSKVEALGRAYAHLWFPRTWMGRQTQDKIGRSEQRHAIAQLDTVMESLRGGALTAYDETRAAVVAFWAAVHPAYLWPESLSRHAMFSALGWLGFCARGRGAILPVDIAEWLVDAIEMSDAGDPVIPDETFGRYVRDVGSVGVLRAAAQARLAGRQTTVRLKGIGRTISGACAVV